MFVLDTNVISELRRRTKANKRVFAWAAGVPAESLFLTSMTILELEIGVLSIERRDARQGAMLRAWLEQQILPAFAGRILPFDTAVARRCADLHVPNRRSERDAVIAVTALVHGMSVVTRNVADFAATGVALVDPWNPHRVR